tara:strand:- start:8622 stop:9221 length:600 start_codon:yes stop_codon:yes gene_type:complete
MHELDNNYTLWMHMLYDNDWSINSYKKIYTFNTIENAACLIENLSNEIIEKTMIFLMKNDIKPIWEVEENKKGGCFSYKITTCYIYELWKKMSYILIGNSLIDDNIIVKNINGISISPKKNYCIFKIWINDIANFNESSVYDFIKYSIENFNKEEILTQNKEENNNNESKFKYNDPFNIHEIGNIDKQICLFKKHECLY